MHEQEMTWGYAIKIWWSVIWRATLIGIAIGLPVGFVLTMMNTAPIVDFVIFNLVIAPVATIIAIKMIIGNRYSGAKLVLVEAPGEET